MKAEANGSGLLEDLEDKNKRKTCFLFFLFSWLYSKYTFGVFGLVTESFFLNFIFLFFGSKRERGFFTYEKTPLFFDLLLKYRP